MYLIEKTGASTGNLSIQITKLNDAGYIEVEKTFRNKRPRTICRMTEKGREAFTGYVAALHELLSPAISGNGVGAGLCLQGE